VELADFCAYDSAAARKVVLAPTLPKTQGKSYLIPNRAKSRVL
jgi:hypothetical protein